MYATSKRLHWEAADAVWRLPPHWPPLPHPRSVLYVAATLAVRHRKNYTADSIALLDAYWRLLEPLSSEFASVFAALHMTSSAATGAISPPADSFLGNRDSFRPPFAPNTLGQHLSSRCDELMFASCCDNAHRSPNPFASSTLTPCFCVGSNSHLQMLPGSEVRVFAAVVFVRNSRFCRRGAHTVVFRSHFQLFQHISPATLCFRSGHWHSRPFHPRNRSAISHSRICAIDFRPHPLFVSLLTCTSSQHAVCLAPQLPGSERFSFGPRVLSQVTAQRDGGRYAHARFFFNLRRRILLPLFCFRPCTQHGVSLHPADDDRVAARVLFDYRHCAYFSLMGFRFSHQQCLHCNMQQSPGICSRRSDCKTVFATWSHDSLGLFSHLHIHITIHFVPKSGTKQKVDHFSS